MEFSDIQEILENKITSLKLNSQLKNVILQEKLQAANGMHHDPAVEQSIRQALISKTAGTKSPGQQNIDLIIAQLITDPRFVQVLELCIYKVLADVVGLNLDKTESLAAPNFSQRRLQHENQEQKASKTIPEKVIEEKVVFVLPKRIRKFDVDRKLEKFAKTGASKEEIADYFCKIQEEETSLIQEGKLCPHCHSLDTIYNGHCYKCDTDVNK